MQSIHFSALVKRAQARVASSLLLAFLGVSLAMPAHAAPMDALLDARPARYHQFGYLEVGADAVNKSLDVLGLLDESVADGVGDYQGGHLRFGWQVSDRVWLEGSAWQREVSLGSEKPRIDSYSAAAQYRLLDQPSFGSLQPDLGLRVSYWSNQSKSVKRRGSLPISDPFISLLESIEISGVKDEQRQLDLIASWAISSRLSFSLSAGVGKGSVSVGGVSGTAFSGAVTARNGGGCSNTFTGKLGETPFPLPEVDVISVDKDICHDHTYKQIGANVQWLPAQNWSLRAGYLFQSIDRGSLDERFREAGGKPITEGHTLIGEAAYRFAKFGQIFVRGQLMSGPFLGEIPMLYNRITAPRFDKEYGFVTVGLVLDF